MKTPSDFSKHLPPTFQLRDLLTRSILSYVEVFTDRRKLPLIEMELVLDGDKICFSPSLKEVTDMMVSVVFEVMDAS